MSKSFLENLDRDYKVASQRVASKQTLTLIKSSALGRLQRWGVPKIWTSKLGKLLDSNIGETALATAVGFTFAYLPPFKHDKRARFLASDWKKNGLNLVNMIWRKP